MEMIAGMHVIPFYGRHCLVYQHERPELGSIEINHAMDVIILHSNFNPFEQECDASNLAFIADLTLFSMLEFMEYSKKRSSPLLNSLVEFTMIYSLGIDFFPLLTVVILNTTSSFINYLEENRLNFARAKRLFYPLLSVIIPFYNNHRWLIETLDSLKHQTFSDFEVLIIDDASNNAESLTFLNNLFSSNPTCYENSFPYKLIRHASNMKLPATRNTGALVSKAKYIAFLDPDDLIDPMALEKMILKAQFVSFDFGNTIGYIYTQMVHFREEENSYEEFDLTSWIFDGNELKSENKLSSFALIPRELYLAMGGNAERCVKYWEDHDYWLRNLFFGLKGCFLPEPLFKYRRHCYGQSTEIRKTEKSCWMQELKNNNPILYGFDGPNNPLSYQSLNPMASLSNRILDCKFNSDEPLFLDVPIEERLKNMKFKRDNLYSRFDCNCCILLFHTYSDGFDELFSKFDVIVLTDGKYSSEKKCKQVFEIQNYCKVNAENVLFLLNYLKQSRKCESVIMDDYFATLLGRK